MTNSAGKGAKNRHQRGPSRSGRQGPTKGWLYVITNQAMPGLVKIGCSSKDPQARADEFSRAAGTGMPFPYQVSYQVWTSNFSNLERAVHESLRQIRIDHEGASGKEWFSCDVASAIAAIRAVLPQDSLEVSPDTNAPIAQENARPDSEADHGSGSPDIAEDMVSAKGPDERERVKNTTSRAGDRNSRWNNGYRNWAGSRQTNTGGGSPRNPDFGGTRRVNLVCSSCGHNNGSLTLTRYEQPSGRCSKCGSPITRRVSWS